MRRTPRTRASVARRARSLRAFHPAVQPLESRQLLAFGDGLRATYFDRLDLSGSSISRVDPTVDFDWGRGSPAAGMPVDHFSARWDGQVQVPAAGDWTFSVTGDEGVRLWIDGQAVIDDWAYSNGAPRTGSINLASAGPHAIHLEYFEQRLDASIHLGWSGPGTAQQIIPQANLAPEPGSLMPPTTVRALATVPGSIGLSWVGSHGATGYQVLRSPDGSTNWEPIGTATTASFTDAGRVPGTTWFYRVRATDGPTTSADSAVASASASLIADPSFEIPVVGPDAIGYDFTGSPWVASRPSYHGDGAGISGASSPATVVNPLPPGGTQVSILSAAGSLSQQVAGWTAGTYTLSFLAARGANGGDAGDFLVLIDGASVGKFTPQSTSYQAYTTVPFAVAAGTHTITFQGLNLGVFDRSVLIDDVSLADVTATTPTSVAAPPGVATYAAGPRSITVSWIPSQGATGYRLERSSDGSSNWETLDEPATTSYTDTGLTPGATWFYRVRAKVGSDVTSPSPAGWAKASLLGDPSFEMTPVPFFTVDTTPAGTPWTFSGYGTAGASGISSVFASHTNANGLPPDGTQVAFLQGGATIGQQVANWAAGTYTISFKAAQGLNIGSVKPPQIVRVSLDGSSLGSFLIDSPDYQAYTTLPFVVLAGTHTISLEGLNEFSEASVALIDLTSVTDVTGTAPTPMLPRPDGFVVFPRDAGSLGLSWKTVYGAAGYQVQWSGDGSTNWTPLDSTTNASLVDAGLTPGMTRYYRVRAIAGSVASGYSATVMATTSLIGDPGFEMIPLALGTMVTTTAATGSPWTFSAGANPGADLSGVSSVSSYVSTSSPLPPGGKQVAYLQGGGSFDQQVADWAAGTYILSFMAARGVHNNPNRPAQDVRVTVDGAAVGTFTIQDPAYQAYTTAPFTVPAGAHTISLTASNTGNLESYALVDQIQVSDANAGSTPSIPGGIEARNQGPREVRISWLPVTGATGYQVERSGDGVSSWTAMANPTGTSWVDSDLKPGISWSYRVRANADGSSSDYSPVVSASASLLGDPEFDITPLVHGEYTYSPGIASTPWVFSGRTTTGESGISGGGTSYTSAIDGTTGDTQVAFVRGDGSIIQQVSDCDYGTYVLSFRAASGNGGTTNDASSDIEFLIDGKSVGKFTIQGPDFRTIMTIPFRLGDGAHTVQVKGLDAPDAQAWTLLDGIRLDPLVLGMGSDVRLDASNLNVLAGVVYSGKIGEFTTLDSAKTPSDFVAKLFWGDPSDTGETAAIVADANQPGRFLVTTTKLPGGEGSYPYTLVLYDGSGEVIRTSSGSFVAEDLDVQVNDVVFGRDDLDSIGRYDWYQFEVRKPYGYFDLHDSSVDVSKFRATVDVGNGQNPTVANLTSDPVVQGRYLIWGHFGTGADPVSQYFYSYPGNGPKLYAVNIKVSDLDDGLQTIAGLPHYELMTA